MQDGLTPTIYPYRDPEFRLQHLEVSLVYKLIRAGQRKKDFRIEEIRIVRVIAETPSVSKAAQLLDMPQSSVSHALTALKSAASICKHI